MDEQRYRIQKQENFDFVMDEFRYVVVTARTRANSDIDEVYIDINEEW